MPTQIVPVVGAFYRPPAKLVLDTIPVGTPLFISAEPDNAFDANACAVWIETTAIPASALPALEEKLPSFGLELDDFLQAEQWHLGYIKKEIAAVLRAHGVVQDDTALSGEFAMFNNKPGIKIEVPD